MHDSLTLNFILLVGGRTTYFRILFFYIIYVSFCKNCNLSVYRILINHNRKTRGKEVIKRMDALKLVRF
jgi:hypothetical protein